MTQHPKRLRQQLHAAGFSKEVVRAAWPDWWSSRNAAPTDCDRLAQTLAEKLGVSKQRLSGERSTFEWKGTLKFKKLGIVDRSITLEILHEFFINVAEILIKSTDEGTDLNGCSAQCLRNTILASGRVDLSGLLSLCWASGIPTFHLTLSPIRKINIFALTVSIDKRNAIILRRQASYPALTLFTLAHEIAHIALGHTTGRPCIVDVNDPLRCAASELEERKANEYALYLLTGLSNPEQILPSIVRGPVDLANFATLRAIEHDIEPGLVVLLHGYKSHQWATSMTALRLIYARPNSVSKFVNEIGFAQIALKDIDYGIYIFLRNIFQY